MNLDEAKTLARKLLNDFDLEDVGFEWTRGKRILGQARWRHGVRTLRLSSYLVELNGVDEVEGVIRHEIAHFKAGRHAGHGYEWKRWAVICGANPNRLNHTAIMPEHKYVICCSCCGKEIGKRHRRSNLASKYHPACGLKSVGKLIWKLAA